MCQGAKARIACYEVSQNSHRIELVIESGHPLGLFASHPSAPRVIITNFTMVGLYDNIKDWR